MYSNTPCTLQAGWADIYIMTRLAFCPKDPLPQKKLHISKHFFLLYPCKQMIYFQSPFQYQKHVRDVVGITGITMSCVLRGEIGTYTC